MKRAEFLLLGGLPGLIRHYTWSKIIADTLRAQDEERAERRPDLRRGVSTQHPRVEFDPSRKVRRWRYQERAGRQCKGQPYRQRWYGPWRLTEEQAAEDAAEGRDREWFESRVKHWTHHGEFLNALWKQFKELPPQHFAEQTLRSYEPFCDPRITSLHPLWAICWIVEHKLPEDLTDYPKLRKLLYIRMGKGINRGFTKWQEKVARGRVDRDSLADFPGIKQ